MTPCLRSGLRENRDLPYLLVPVNRYRDGDGSLRDAMHPWPVGFISLPEPPPPDMPAAHERYASGDPDRHLFTDRFLWPDDPLAFNVVRFKATPLRRGPDGRYLGAAALNAAHRLNADNPDEWPVLLAPDVVEIELQVIGDETASRFTDQDDWLNWQSDPVLTGLVERESRIFRIRIPVGG